MDYCIKHDFYSTESTCPGCYQDEADRLRKEHKILLDVVTYYADAQKWQDVETGIGMYPGEAVDYGATARQALEEILLKIERGQ